MVPNDVLDQLAESIASKVAARLAPARAPKRLLSASDTATYLGRSLSAIKHMTAAGELPTVRVGRRVHYDLADLDRWIASNKV